MKSVLKSLQLASNLSAGINVPSLRACWIQCFWQYASYLDLCDVLVSSDV